MKLTRYDNTEAFWRDASPFLLADEAVNNLMISIVRSLLDNPKLYRDPYFAVGAEDGAVVAAALMTPPHNLLLCCCDDAFRRLVLCDLGESIAGVRGVTGPDAVPKAFGELVTASTGMGAELAMSLRTFKLTQVTDQPPAPGRFDLAGTGDRAALTEMIAGFVHDAHVDANASAAKEAERLVAGKSIYVWRDESGVPVSMAGTATGDTPRGKRLGWVYTPSHLRGRGYASSVVAALSRRILESGKQFCFLFTDLSNPVSNRIYRRIGYEPICDFSDYRFQPVSSAS